MNSPQYRRVASDDSHGSNGVNSPRSGAGLPASGGRSAADRVMDKLIAFAWVILALVVAYWTSFFSVLLGSSSEANRTLLNIAFLCLGTNMVLTAYLLVYLPHVKKLKDSSAWSVYCPRVIPMMILLGIVCGLLLIRGTWPVWGFFAPLVLGIEAMGFLFSLHLVPKPPSL